MAHNRKTQTAAVPIPRVRIRKKFTLPTRAKQSFKEECDINIIMAKYKARGIVTHVTKYQGHYQDLPNEIDYHHNLQSVMDAKAAFDSLPAKIRERFKNDPAQFLGFVMDPKNQSEIDKMGLGLNPAPASELPDSAILKPNPDTDPVPAAPAA